MNMGRALDRARSPIAPGALGTGTPDDTKFLRGDGTWQTLNLSPSTADVLTATAGATAGAVGTYCAAYHVSSGSATPGGTVAGSALRATNGATGAVYNPGFSGTWRNMGGSNISTSNSWPSFSAFLRIA